MKASLLSLLFIITGTCVAQNIKSGDYNFRFIKAKRNSKLFQANTSNYSIRVPRDQKKIQVRFKMKSVSGEKEDFDPNKFYLVSDSYKVRVRPMDIKHNFAAGMVFIGFPFLINKEPKDQLINRMANYKPDIKDTFWDYKIDGYEDVSYSVNFGTKRKPKNISPYLDHRDLRACRIDIYFAVPKKFEKGIVYYGEKVIANFTL